MLSSLGADFGIGKSELWTTPKGILNVYFFSNRNIHLARIRHFRTWETQCPFLFFEKHGCGNVQTAIFMFFFTWVSSWRMFEMKNNLKIIM